jgi:hypothetical protein
VTFETTVTASVNNTGSVVPDEVIERLGAGSVRRCSSASSARSAAATDEVMGGRCPIGISAAICKDTGLSGPSRVHLTARGQAVRVWTVPRRLRCVLREA